MTEIDDRMAMFSPQQIAEFERKSSLIRERMSPAGKLGLPKLLDDRRLEWGIIDSAFALQAAYDRIIVHQIPPRHYAKGTFGEGSRIVLSDVQKDGEVRKAPRGIVISAGLRALDEMRSNGIELGDIIMYNHVMPWRIEYDMIDGKMVYALVMHSGHILGSEDTAERLRKNALRISTEQVDGRETYIYCDREGRKLIPVVSESREF